MDQTVLQKVINVLMKYNKSDLTSAQITPETHILLDLKINSARLVDIVLDFEDEFDLQIQDEDTDEIYTVGKAVNLIESLLQKKV